MHGGVGLGVVRILIECALGCHSGRGAGWLSNGDMCVRLLDDYRCNTQWLDIAQRLNKQPGIAQQPGIT